MAALSDYLESGLLSHIFRNAAFPRPSTIAVALTSGVPLDSNDGTNIPELKSSVQDGDLTRSTNYSRVNLFNPATSGDNTWNAVGVDATTAYSVSGNKRDGSTGYFYPLYLNQQAALSHSGGNGTSTVYTFDNIFPSVVFYGPNGTNVFSSGTQSKSSYPDYEGNGFIRNKNQIVFNTALTEWGWVSGIAILDNAGVGSGNLLMYSKLANPRYVYIGDNIRFDANSLEISLK